MIGTSFMHSHSITQKRECFCNELPLTITHQQFSPRGMCDNILRLGKEEYF